MTKDGQCGDSSLVLDMNEYYIEHRSIESVMPRVARIVELDREVGYDGPDLYGDFDLFIFDKFKSKSAVIANVNLQQNHLGIAIYEDGLFKIASFVEMTCQHCFKILPEKIAPCSFCIKEGLKTNVPADIMHASTCLDHSKIECEAYKVANSIVSKEKYLLCDDDYEIIGAADNIILCGKIPYLLHIADGSHGIIVDKSVHTAITIWHEKLQENITLLDYLNNIYGK